MCNAVIVHSWFQLAVLFGIYMFWDVQVLELDTFHHGAGLANMLDCTTRNLRHMLVFHIFISYVRWVMRNPLIWRLEGPISVLQILALCGSLHPEASNGYYSTFILLCCTPSI